MPYTPAWDRPQTRQMSNEFDKDCISELLEKQGIKHLKVLSRGTHLVVYSEYEGDKVSRVRFTRIGQQTYELGIANHRGKWEATPFTGTINELFTTLTQELGWILSEF